MRPPILLLQQVPGRPRHRHNEAHTRRIRPAGHAHLRQPHPAADQRRGHQQADSSGNQQRAQRGGGVAHATQHGGDQQKCKHAGRGNQHDAGVFRGAGQDVGRCAQGAQHGLGERAAKQRHHNTCTNAHAEGGARNRLHALGLFRAPGLPDQHRSARAQTDHECNQKKQHREERRHRGHGTHAQHLAQVNVVDRARQRLQDVADDHGHQKGRVDPPKHWRHWGCWVGCCRQGGLPVFDRLMPKRRRPAVSSDAFAHPPASLQSTLQTLPDPPQTGHGWLLQNPPHAPRWLT